MHGSFLSNRLSFAVEDWWAVRDEITPVWEQHNLAIAAPDDQNHLSPDWSKFQDLALRNQSQWVTVRHFGKIVGYSFVIVTTHLHRKTKLCGFYDLYWLHPDYRKGTRAGINLIKFTDQALRERGVTKIYIGTKFWHDIGPLLKRMGYEPAETIYTKAVI